MTATEAKYVGQVGSRNAASTIDLADPATFAGHDLTNFWQRLRDEEPIYWNPPTGGRRGFWVLSRHADILEVYRDDMTFTSERGNVLVTLLAGGDAGAGRMLAVTDGPRHAELRKLLLRALGPRVLGPVCRAVRANTRQMIGEAAANGECDFATDIASRIPMITISNLLGVPEADRASLLKMTKTALSADDESISDTDSEMARNEILLYFQDFVEFRRKNPGEDVVSMLVNSSIDGVPLSDDDIVLNCYSLIIGGDETSRLTMIDSINTLAANPGQWRRLKEGRCDIDKAVDEVLRWASPSMHFGRTAVRETVIHGERIQVDDIVTLWGASGNRDERAFKRPEVFDLDRAPNRHLSFGHGPHYCIGSYLAKVEISELLIALRDLILGFEVIGEPQRIRSNLLSGFSTMPVRFHADRTGLASEAREG